MNTAIMQAISSNEYESFEVYRSLRAKWPQINEQTRLVYSPARIINVDPHGERIELEKINWMMGRDEKGDLLVKRMICAYFAPIDLFLIWDQNADMAQVAAALRPLRSMRAPESDQP